MKLATFGLLGLLLVGLVTAGFGWNNEARTAIDNNDFQGWKQAMNSELTEDRFNHMKERHGEMQEHRTEMEAAILQGYDAWKALVEEHPRGRITEVITEDNFDKFVEMHNAKQNGDFETAQQIAEELGLQARNKFGGRHCGRE